MEENLYPLPKIEVLNKILKSQLDLYKELLSLVRHEKEFIVKVDISKIREYTLAKEIILSQLRREEVKHKKWLLELAKMRNQTLEELSAIVKLYPKGEGERSMYLKNSLHSITLQVQRFNEENKRLVERALKESQMMKGRALGYTADQPPLYSPKGQFREAVHTSSRFISEKV